MDEADGGNGGERSGNREGDRNGTAVRRRDGDEDGTPPVTAEYYETGAERVLAFERGGRTAAVVQNRDGYAMLAVRTSAQGDELERYYGFEMALDHAAERLGVRPDRLPVPGDAADMGI
jgi:hypothetical protein